MSTIVNPKIKSVATALPPYRVGQDQIIELTRELFGKELSKYDYIWRRSGVENRYMCVHPAELLKKRMYGQKNDLYISYALDLAQKAAERAIIKAEITPSDVDALFVCSVTGEMHPSLDTILQRELELPGEHTETRIDTGHGCAAGADALAAAADWTRTHPGTHALVVAVELCSLTFESRDTSLKNLVGASLFSDGAGAAVVGPAEIGPEIIGEDCIRWPDTEHVMGWRHDEHGRWLLLSNEVPKLVKQHLRSSVVRSAEHVGLNYSDLRHFALHPGGRGVLDAMEDVLNLENGELAESRAILRENGNMSSVTVLAILEQFIQRHGPNGDLGLLSAMGPGFRVRNIFFIS